MTLRTRLTAVLAIPLLALALANCGGDGGSTYPDVPHDYVVEDLAVDTTPDIPVDTTPDTVFDPGIDTFTDTDTITPDPIFDDVGPVTGGVGSACTGAGSCTGVPGAGRLCLTDFMSYLSFPGGYCSAVCTSAADCGTGSACVDLFGFDQYCLKTCTSPSQCRTAEGYSCTTLSGVTGGPYCVPPAPDPETATDY